jgi:parallel beta-helix repeat protein/predicted outer membrane repeat protein
MKKLSFILAYLLLTVPCLAGTITVDDDGPADFDNIQAAINHSNNGDFVFVFPGTYTGSGNYDIDFLGKAITVRSENGPNNCIIDCNDMIDYGDGYVYFYPHNGFGFHNNEDANSVLDGFTITNCRLHAISCYSSPTIKNCIITGNTGREGGGIYCYGSPTITNCTITGNLVSRGNGGGIYCGRNSKPKITNCIISGNTAERWGGGVYCDDSSPVITNCTITGNSAGGDGGGIFCEHNTSIPPKVANCTIDGNSAEGLGGGICLADSSLSVSVTSSIIWGNSDSSGAGQSAQVYSGKPDVWFSCIQDDNPDDVNVPFGTDRYNIDDDPCFVGSDYHLLAASPCIDTGNPFFTYHLGDVDIDGQPRLMGRCVDMGADEFEISVIVVTKPKGGEVWTGGSTHEIKWDSYGITGSVDISYSTNNGANRVKIANVPDTGSFIWHLPTSQFPWLRRKPPIDSNQCLVSVKPHTPVSNLTCIESGPFTIQPYRNGPPLPWWSRYPYRQFGPKYGCVKWQFQTGGPVTAGVTIGCNNRVHVPCEDGKLYTLNAAGKLLWTYDTNSPLVCSPAVDRCGNTYVGAENGKLYAIDRIGRLLWTHTTDGPIYSSPVVLFDNPFPWPYWNTHSPPWEQPIQILACSVDGTLYALGRDGSELWSFETDSVSAVTTGAILASPAIGRNNTMYIAGLYDPNLYALDPDDDGVKWNCNFPGPVNPSGRRPWPFASPVIAENGTIYQALLYDPNLYAINPNNGNIIWSTSLAGLVLRYGRNPDEYIIWYGVGDPPEYIEVNGRQFRVIEVSPYLYGSCWSKPALAPDGTIYVSFDDPYLRAVDPNGTIKWMTKLGAVGGFTLTVGGDGLIYAACDDANLYVVDPNGQQVAQFEGFGGLSFPTITIGRTIIVSDANNTVWAIGQYFCKDQALALHRLEDPSGDGIVNGANLTQSVNQWLNKE